MTKPLEKNKFEIQNQFYKTLNQPLQNPCKILKKIGGNWEFVGFLNGEKMICMDNLYEAIKNDSCLIYSFGLADNWDFEVAMAELGMFTLICMMPPKILFAPDSVWS